MPYIDVNNAHIYYQAYGEDPSSSLRAGREPIVLIHGSTNTSHNDWDAVIPALAKEYKVFAPDCRGHGKSNNPNMSYSFKELADDVAAFVRAMGYERAHIIGHSNGGNVALVTLLEHPEIIQTCIPQAANAYVTRYLIEREPVYFDAQRIEREATEWMNEMGRHLHFLRGHHRRGAGRDRGAGPHLHSGHGACRLHTGVRRRGHRLRLDHRADDSALAADHHLRIGDQRLDRRH